MRLDTKEKRAQYRASCVPAGAVRDARSSEAAEAFTHERERAGYAPTTIYLAIGFWGASGKPSFHYSYRSPEDRERKLAEFFASAGSHRERMNAQRAKAADFKHTLKVGDILHTSWGYDQTNVTFFEVTRVVSDKSVAVRSIRSSMTHSPGMSPMSGYVTGNKGEFVGPEHVRRVREGNVVVNCEYSYAGTPGAGPTYCSWYA